MDIKDLIPYIPILGFILMAAGYALAQLRLGGRGVAKEIIDNYKTRQDQLEISLKEATAQIIQLRLELANVQGQLTEKDKKIAELTTIFQGKDPELLVILKEIRDFLKRLDSQSLTNQDRNIAIDMATKKEEGKILRKK